MRVNVPSRWPFIWPLLNLINIIESLKSSHWSVTLSNGQSNWLSLRKYHRQQQIACRKTLHMIFKGIIHQHRKMSWSFAHFSHSCMIYTKEDILKNGGNKIEPHWPSLYEKKTAETFFKISPLVYHWRKSHVYIWSFLWTLPSSGKDLKHILLVLI